MSILKSVLVIDIGGVFFSPEWRKRGISVVSRELGVKQELFKSALEKNKNDFYLGKIAEEEYWRRTLELLHLDRHLSGKLIKRYREFVVPISEAVNLLPKLSIKYTLVAFNNSSREWMDYRIKLASLNRYFKLFLTSGYTGYLKPEKKAFSHLLNHFPKVSLIYADDNEAYLKRARYLYKNKIKTHLIRSYEDLHALSF